ncbi:MAG: alpha/beta hydrolase [Ruminococcus sp.]|nr:alpha/beta hydrolase [Ruminococcus sp.]
MNVIELDIDYKKAGLAAPDTKPTLKCFVPEKYAFMKDRKRGAILVLPGGGYEYCSEREGDPVAYRFLGQGYACFVLHYSCVDKKFPTALLECAAAVKYIRSNAEEFGIAADKVFVMGFSAGGHLAASMANLWNSSLLSDVLGCGADTLKVNGSVLGYPVILSEPELTHEGSVENLLMHRRDPELREFLSMEKRVGKQTPPTFIWHCADDGCVPVENSLSYMAALSKARIPFEGHIFPSGGHGLSLCDGNSASEECHYAPVPAAWVGLCFKWLEGIMKA